MKLSKITKFPQYVRTLRYELTALQKDVQKINHVALSATDEIQKLKEQLNKIQENLDKLEQQNAELEHQLSVSARPVASAINGEPATQRFADNHLLDAFYLELENSLRGTEAEIKQKQQPYMELFQKTDIDYQKYPVIDIGSGRGEFLDLLQDYKIRAIGVDLNESMVKRMHDKGFDAVYADAIQYLLDAKSNSLGAIVGFHIAEHLPFEQLLTLITEARRVLIKGGFLLLETPNPETLPVGAFTFYHDPSHLKPLPPALMEFTAKFRGYSIVEILRRQPELTDKQIQAAAKSDKHLLRVYTRIFGPRDYALLAYK